MKKYIVHAWIAVLTLASGIAAEASAALGTDPAVSSGRLDCGLSYYLVTNDSGKGLADFALVRKINASTPEARKAETEFSRACLDSLPHFAGRPPLGFLSDHGISYPVSGYISVEDDAVLYHFRDVRLSRTPQTADSTMLMLFDIALESALRSPAGPVAGTVSDQAVIISGDIDRESLIGKMKMLSLMINRDMPASEVADTAAAADNVRPEGLTIDHAVDSVGGTVSVNVRFSGPEIPRKLRGSSVSLISARFWSEFQSAARIRISAVLRSAGIPYSSVKLYRYSSADAAEREKYLVTAGVYPDDTARVKDVILSVLSDFRENGLGHDEYRYSRNVASRNLYFRSVARSKENSDYVRKCADAFVYGSAVISAQDEAAFFLSSGLPDSTGRRLLNEYLAALIPECGDMVPAENVHPAFKMSDTLLLVSEQPAVRVRKTRQGKGTGADIWYFSNGMVVMYRKMPTDGIMHYSWVMRGGYGSVPDLRAGEGAFYSDLLFKGDVCGMRSSDFRNLLSSEGISMNSEVGLSGMRIYGKAPFSRMTLLMKSLLSVARTYAEDDMLGQYYLECERLRLSSGRGEYRSRLAVIDSIMSPGYRYYPDKSLSGLYPDLPVRAEKFYRDMFSKANDGALILVGDMDPYDVRKIMESYLGGFETQDYMAIRPRVAYQPVSGWSTYVTDGRTNTIDVVLSSRIVLNSLNYMSAQIVTMALKDAIAGALSGSGMSVKVKDSFSVFPHERYAVSVSAMPALLSSLPPSVSRDSYFKCLYRIRAAVSGLTAGGISEADVNTYKAALSDRYASIQADPEVWTRMFSDRVSTGKSLDTGYSDKISGVSAESVNRVLSELNGGCTIEYVIKKD